MGLRYTEKNWEDWGKLLKDLFTSRSGFTTWYSNDPPRIGRTKPRITLIWITLENGVIQGDIGMRFDATETLPMEESKLL